MPKAERRAILAALALTVTVHILAPGQTATNLSYILATSGATVLAAGAVLRRHERPPWPWRLVAVAIALSLVADLVYGGYDWFLELPAGELSAADPFWLAAYGVLLSAIVAMLLAARGPERRRILSQDRLVDLAVGTVVAVLVLWNLLTLGGWRASFDDLEILVIAAYPVMALVILVLLVALMATRARRLRSAVLLTIGVGCWLAGDLTLLITSHFGGASPDLGRARWFTGSWMVGIVLLAMAPHEPDAAELTMPPEPVVDEPVGAGRLALGMAPLLVPIILYFWAELAGGEPNLAVITTGALTLIGLAYARVFRVWRSWESSQDALRRRERYFRALSAQSSDAVLVIDRKGIVRNQSLTMGELMGRPHLETSDRFIFDLVDIIEEQAARQLFDQLLLAPGEPHDAEFEVEHADGTHRWFSARATNLLDDEDVRGIVLQLHDVTDRKAVERELHLRAFQDELTGLANRSLFMDRLDHALRRRRRPAVVYVDLDGFKAVNDNFGHEAGDELLRVVAARLLNVVGGEDTVARLGGDEFAVLVEERDRPDRSATLVAEDILGLFGDAVQIRDHTFAITASIGVASGDPGATAASLLRDADIAMYRAKSAGKDQWVMYEPGMRAAALERHQIEVDLPTALSAGELTLVFQPVVELDSEAITGFEALCRWDHPTLGRIGPDRFIPVAETSGQIVAIGTWVLQGACHQLARWIADHDPPSPITMAVNVSGRQLTDPGLVDAVTQALRSSGLDPRNLVLEVTETALVEDPAAAAARLAALHTLGVRLAIDDFGTGYSSLSYLRLFPIDILKIDRSFIDTIDAQEGMPALVRGLLELGRTLQLELVAEGIEQPYQRELLSGAGCRLGQGYLFHRPMPPDEAGHLLASGDLAATGKLASLG